MQLIMQLKENLMQLIMQLKENLMQLKGTSHAINHAIKSPCN
jgi:hypothetical protein